MSPAYEVSVSGTVTKAVATVMREMSTTVTGTSTVLCLRPTDRQGIAEIADALLARGMVVLDIRVAPDDAQPADARRHTR
jgi:FtsZ-interacting cell division protein YlmF